MKQLTAIAFWMLWISFLSAQTETKVIKKSLSFTNPSNENMLIIRNINGGIEVTHHDNPMVELEMELTIKGHSKELRDKGFSEVKLGIAEKSQTIVFFMDNPCSNNDVKTLTESDWRKGSFNQWSGNCTWRPKYDYQLNYKVKVPKGIHVHASTVNNGDISVSKHVGKITVNNVNGAITLDQVAGAIEAHAVNGDLNINYTANPKGNSSYYTLNGDINANFLKGLSADVYFKSFNGNFFTDVDPVEMMPTVVKKEISDKKSGFKLKIGQEKGIKLRQGGVKLAFETFNGDVYVKEK